MSHPHITVAVENNDEAQGILRVAQRLAAERDANLTIICAIQPFYTLYADVAYQPTLPDGSSIEEAARRECNRSLSELVGDICPKAELRLPIGDPRHEIVQVANNQHSHLIVMGLHSRKGLSRLLGSTTAAVLSGSECDLLAVRPADAPADGYERVLIGVDSTTTAGHVMEAAKPFAERAQTVVIETVVPPISSIYGPVPAAAGESWPFPAVQEDLMKAATARVVEMAKCHGYRSDQVVVEAGQPADTL